MTNPPLFSRNLPLALTALAAVATLAAVSLALPAAAQNVAPAENTAGPLRLVPQEAPPESAVLPLEPVPDGSPSTAMLPDEPVAVPDSRDMPPPEAIVPRSDDGDRPTTDDRPAGDGLDMPDQAATGSVADLQRRLNALGYDAGPVDGLLGPRTRAAVRAYAERVGIAAAGLDMPNLLDRLAGRDDGAGRPAGNACAASTSPPEVVASRAREPRGRIGDRRIEVAFDRLIDRLSSEGYHLPVRDLRQLRREFRTQRRQPVVSRDFFGIEKLPADWRVTAGTVQPDRRHGLRLMAGGSLLRRMIAGVAGFLDASVEAGAAADDRIESEIAHDVAFGEAFHVRVRFLAMGDRGALRVSLLQDAKTRRGYAVRHDRTPDADRLSLSWMPGGEGARQVLADYALRVGLDSGRLHVLEASRDLTCRLRVTLNGVALLEARHEAAGRFAQIRIGSHGGEYRISEIGLY